MARKAGVLGVVVTVMLFVVGADRALAYDYETCFAFDPVFVQADQRRAARAAPEPKPRPVHRAEREGATPSPLRLSLARLRQALKALARPVEKPSVKPSGREAR